MSKAKIEKLTNAFPEWPIAAVFLGLFIAASLTVPHFFDTGNLFSIIVQMAPVGIIAVGMTFVIVSGGIDLSVGSVLAMVSVLMAGPGNYPLAIMLILALFWGTLAGAANGILISIGHMSAFIATLSTMAIAKGIALWSSNTQERVILDPNFAIFGSGSFLGIPVPVLLFIGVTVAGQIVLRRTVFGKQVCAVGSNPVAAKHAGVKVQQVKFFVYTLTGFLVGLSALIISSRLNISTPTVGEFYELDAIAAVVIGGTLLTGGRGSVFGTLIGVLIFGLIANVLNLQGTSPYVQRIAKGSVIIIAVLMQSGGFFANLRFMWSKVLGKNIH